MQNETHPRRRLLRRRLLRACAVGLLLACAALLLAACGSSSTPGTTSNSASTTKPGTTGSNRFSALRECLKKEGINLPSRPNKGSGGGAPPASGNGTLPGGRAGGFKLPEGVSRSKFQEAIKKCGGGGFARGARPGFNSASAKKALTKYAACMRENGVNLPAPDTSGKGPVFNTKGIDTSSSTFKNAQKACQGDLKGAFGAGRPPGGGESGPPPGANGAPPTGEGGPPAGAEEAG